MISDNLTTKQLLLGLAAILGVFALFAYMDENPVIQQSVKAPESVLASDTESTKVYLCGKPNRDYSNSDLNQFCKGVL